MIESRGQQCVVLAHFLLIEVCSMSRLACVLICVSVVQSPCTEASEQVELIGVGQFSGAASDLSGHSGVLENGEPHDRLGGFSALEYTGEGHRYVALPDRGPDDGATGYLCRFQWLDIVVKPQSEHPVSLKLVDSVFLKDREQRAFTGASSAMSATDQTAGRFDPEGFRFGTEGNFYVSDEYGPQLIEFRSTGEEVRRFALPEHLSVLHPADSKAAENAANSIGRSSNKGMEGLAISPDGKQLFGIMQHVLLQDGERDEFGKPVGLNCRLISIDIATGKTREFVYQLDDVSNGLNEILAIDDHTFLVIERDGLIGADAKFKKIMKIDLTNATEISGVDQLPAIDLPSQIQPVRKEVFIDMLAPKFGLKPDQIPEKLEVLTFVDTLADGRETLVVASDNDFNAETSSFFYVFALALVSSTPEAVSARETQSRTTADGS